MISICLCHLLCAFDVIEGRLVIPHSDDHDRYRAALACRFASRLKAMAFVCRSSWNRTDAAEFGESGLGTDAFGLSPTRMSISARSCGEIRGFEHGRYAGGGQCLEIGIMGSDFGIKCQPAPSYCRKAPFAEAVTERIGPAGQPSGGSAPSYR